MRRKDGKRREKEGHVDARREITEEGEARTLRQVVWIITSNGKCSLWVTIVALMQRPFGRRTLRVSLLGRFTRSNLTDQYVSRISCKAGFYRKTRATRVCRVLASVLASEKQISNVFLLFYRFLFETRLLRIICASFRTLICKPNKITWFLNGCSVLSKNVRQNSTVLTSTRRLVKND